MDLGAALTDVQHAVAGAVSVPVYIDQDRINPPCVVITLESVDTDRFGGGGTALWNLFIVDKQRSIPRALTQIGSIFRDLTNGLPVHGADVVTYVSGGHGNQELPALHCTIETTLED